MKLDVRPPYVLLEDRLSAEPARIFRDPVEVIRCDDPAALGEALRRVEEGVAGGLHAAGFIGYEATYALEPRLADLRRSAETPLVWFGLFDQVRDVPAEALDEAMASLGPTSPLADVRPAHSLEEHAAKVAKVLAYIAAGDIYQANLTFPIDFRYEGSPLTLYAALRASQPVAHGGLVATGEHTVLSVSPELFVELRDGRIMTRPMKGTCPRVDDPAADRAAALALASDPKERAENLMIVDLLRNDLSRISMPGTVRVDALFAVETYPTLHSMTSSITARARPDLSLTDRIAALFPCGSIVGAPKIRANEIIAELEARPRGVYTGAIGTIAPGGDMSFNVAIRTAVIGADGRATYGVGGGIVADSDPAAEYAEALLKGRVLTDLAEPYELIETLLWTEDAGFVRLDGHLDRLQRSARQLGFAFDRGQAVAALEGAAKAWVGRGSDRRVRAALARDGRLTITASGMDPVSPSPIGVGVAVERLDAADPFLRHKTTRRATHERAFARASACGEDEALLLNRAGRIADATRHSVFLAQQDRLLTPPIRDGALPGVLRASLIAEGRAVEAELTLAQLESGRWFLGNSLRGLRPAVLTPGSLASARRQAG